jgi:hypothetical protein
MYTGVQENHWSCGLNEGLTIQKSGKITTAAHRVKTA